MSDLAAMSDAELIAAYKREQEAKTLHTMPKTEQTALDRARQEAEAARFQSRAASQFLDLNQTTGTGGLRGLGAFGHTVGDLVAGTTGPNWDIMKGITAAAAPRARIIGSGATSDFEARQMMAGFPSVDKRGDSNSAITKRLQIEDARARARASFLDTWAKKKGTLAGSDEAFSAWWEPYAQQHGLSVLSPRPAGPPRKPVPAAPAGGGARIVGFTPKGG